MVYSGITACLTPRRPSPEEAARNSAKACANKSEDELFAIFLPECQTIAELMVKADRVDNLERKVKNLEYLLSGKADWYRQELAASEQRSLDAVTEQRSLDTDQC